MKICIVGSGVSGLAAAWALNEFSEHQVHIYEADSRPGGHANTVSYSPPGNSDNPVKVDTGFIVFNPPSYPNFLNFLKYINILTIPTEMTFSVSRDRGLFEWAGNNLFTVFCQSKNLVSAGHWRMIWDILRFNACARKLVEQDNSNVELSIGEYLEQEGYSDSFKNNYLIPMTAAIWSTPPDKCSLDFPARTLLRFMYNHHLLQLVGKPAWLTIPGGSHTYVQKILARLPENQLHLSTPVFSVSTNEGGTEKILVRTSEDQNVQPEEFDAVILATHSDTALQILNQGSRMGGKTSGATEDEFRILGAFGWSENIAVLHSDTELMPKNRSAWSCWNYLTASENGTDGTVKLNVDKVALTYSMNHLQHIPEERFGPVLVTLNPPYEPKPELVAGRWTYHHPIVSAESVKAQQLLPTIQNQRGIAFAGAWTKYGFHEDGFTSGLRAASYFFDAKANLPFEIRSPDRVATRTVGEKALGGGITAVEVVRRIVSWIIFVVVGVFVGSGRVVERVKED